MKTNKPCCNLVYRLIKDKGGFSADKNFSNKFSQALPKKNEELFLCYIFL